MNAREIGDRAAARSVADATDRLAAALGDALPAIGVEAVPGGIAIGGHGLKRRLIEEPALRWPGGLLR